jgi:hypothetical protein
MNHPLRFWLVVVAEAIAFLFVFMLIVSGARPLPASR